MSFLLAFSTVFPMFFYMAAGFGLRRLNKLSEGTVAQMNKIIYSFCFPFVLFHNVYGVDIASAMNGPFLAVIAGMVVLVTALLIVFIPRYTASKPVQGSMMQGVIRGNSILFALPVVTTIAGRENTGLVSLGIALVVPFYNILCVIILESLRGGKVKPARLLLSILKNPIIIGTLAGAFVRLTGLRLPGYMEQVVAGIAGLVTPLALVMLGADMRFSDTVKYKKELLIVCLLKLVAVPLLTVLTVKALGFDKIAVTTAMAMTAVPTAVSSYVMAKEMEADGVLAGQIVAVSTAVSILTVFLWVFSLSSLGWI